MAISREEAIELLNTQKPVLGCKEYKKPLMYAYEKAISDMEKLQKIEELYAPKPFGEGLSREDRDREIEQILKEVE